MSTAGAIQGTNFIIQAGVGTPTAIVGQGEFTLTIGGEPVNITNKSSGGFVELLDGATTSQQVVFTGTIVYNSDASYEKIIADAWAGTQDDYTIVCDDVGASNESYAGKFVPHAISSATPADGNHVATSVTFSSSGVVTRTPAT